MADDSTDDKAPDSTPAPSTAPAAPVGGVNLSDLVGRATAQPPEDVTKDLAHTQRELVGEEERIIGGTTAKQHQDMAQVERAYRAEAVNPNDLKPWDAKAEHKKVEADPLESFGSIASVFAITASLFTHQPMVNALNGSAAAITAVRDRKEDEYNRGFDAWKQNTQLAVKRHEMQHQEFQDAMNLMKTNMEVGQNEMRMVAMKYGDKKTLAYLDAGMDKELIDLQNARNKSATDLLHLLPEIEKFDLNQRIYNADPDSKSKDPKKLKALRDRIDKGQLTPMEDAYWKAVEEDPSMDSAARTAKYKELQSWHTAGRTGGTGSTMAGLKRNIIQQKIDEEERAKGRPLSASEKAMVAKKIEGSMSNMTANHRDDVQARMDMYDNSLGTIDEAMDVLDRYTGAAGAFGYVNRMAEHVRDLFGSNDSDREQFERVINYLQVMAPRLLIDSRGRPIASESDKIGKIIGGLRLGDTTANTKRSLAEIRTLYEKMKNDNYNRLFGLDEPLPAPSSGAPAGGGGSDAPVKAAPKKPVKPWDNDPIVTPGKRSESDTEEMYG